MRGRRPRMDYASVKANRQRFFVEFAKFHFIWMHQLVDAYKERGVYPVYPTQIVDYYTDLRDKQVVIFSTFVMKWNNGFEREQIASVRQLIGEHPWEWFANREFVSLSLGRAQMNSIEGYRNGLWWKIAKVYDLLWQQCRDGKIVRAPSEVLPPAAFDKFCAEIKETCMLADMDYKKSIVELVLMTSNGIGRDMWFPRRRVPKCPETAELRDFMKLWFPIWRSDLWTWDESVKLYGLDNGYDFFYAWLAYQDLSKANPIACKKYTTRYQSRWKMGQVFVAEYWKNGRGLQPEIKFE